WVLLGEIVHVSSGSHPRIIARDRDGNPFTVALNNDVDASRILKEWKVGGTVALMHPLARLFLDGTMGVKVKYEVDITIFPCKPDDLIKLNADAIEHNWLVNKEKTCHGCGEKNPIMERCNKCKVAYYCSKV
ncbi:hypothetical protein P280DRAFT_384817, partial [Massarina eburnea CBS 473.64]